MIIEDLWLGVIGTQPAPPPALVLATALLAAAMVGWRRSWRVLRLVVTIAHEGGHAVAAALTGRRLLGVRLHSDTSGLTVSTGPATGPGMVFTLVAGYLAPSVLGLGGMLMLGTGHVTALLWVAVGLLGAMLLLIRNVYGVVAVVGTGSVLVVLSWFASPAVQGAFGYLFVWFLLFAAPRPVLEVRRLRRRGRGADSDPDQLARLTGVGASWWITLFAILTVGAATCAAYWLLPWDQSVAALEWGVSPESYAHSVMS
ncbi:MAG: M50 family metallopeptidase [Pseudonocardiaceae bacterium]